jgi:hypothetical protein
MYISLYIYFIYISYVISYISYVISYYLLYKNRYPSVEANARVGIGFLISEISAFLTSHTTATATATHTGSGSNSGSGSGSGVNSGSGSGSGRRPPFYLHAGHDSTLIPLLLALNIWDGVWTPYASYVNFELYQGSQGSQKNDQGSQKYGQGSQNYDDYYVRVVYNGKVLDLCGNGTGSGSGFGSNSNTASHSHSHSHGNSHSHSHSDTATATASGSMCTLQQFVEIVENITPSRENCAVDSAEKLRVRNRKNRENGEKLTENGENGTENGENGTEMRKMGPVLDLLGMHHCARHATRHN